MEFLEAVRVASKNKTTRAYPGRADTRFRSSALFPSFLPKFQINLEDRPRIFTIGSCFARNIEEVLSPMGVDLPTMAFSAPKSEWPARPNGLLNEFNPGTISQRILFALDNKPYPPETIVPTGSSYSDLLLLGGADVPMKRALERRDQISDVYKRLASSDVVIVTLGYVETWFDQETNLFLNRMPPQGFASKHPSRFIFKRLDVFDCMPMLEAALAALTTLGIKVVLTVSPVPIQTTFSGSDCIVANEFSKSVLRVCAERLAFLHDVDYFPSYEIVRAGGLQSYIEDNVHVKDDLVRAVTEYMVDRYRSVREASAA